MISVQQKISKYNTKTETTKIDVACIQETHNIETTIYEEDGYKIIFSQEETSDQNNDKKTQENAIKEKGGVALNI